jgi:hypothetical protein
MGRLDSVTFENTGILHAGQMTDHAKEADTDFTIKHKQLKYKQFVFSEKLACRVQ